MGLRNITESEHYEFDNLHSLREWLNQFQVTDLRTVNIEPGIVLHWQVETLSDGSQVRNARFTVD